MAQWLGRAAVVTGAGSGFGEAITRSLARIGMRILATDVNVDSVEVITHSMSLT